MTTKRPRIPLVRLLLVVALGLLYWRSYRHADLVGIFVRGGKLQLIGSDRGTTVFWFSNIDFGRQRAWTWQHVTLDDEAAETARLSVYETVPLPAKRIGFAMGRSEPDAFGLTGARYNYFVIPDWVFVSLAGLWMLLGVRRVAIYRRRLRRGQCVACGYDLRETVGVCPECGAAPARTSPVEAVAVKS